MFSIVRDTSHKSKEKELIVNSKEEEELMVVLECWISYSRKKIKGRFDIDGKKESEQRHRNSLRERRNENKCP